MAEANGSVDPGVRPDWRWDVALSFAGAQRSYVDQVVQALKARGVRCFHDADEEIELWGKYLAEELPAIYGEQAAAVVIFVSAGVIPMPRSSRSAFSLSWTSVLVRPVTRLLLRFPSGANPSVTSPRQRPGQCRCLSRSRHGPRWSNEIPPSPRRRRFAT